MTHRNGIHASQTIFGTDLLMTGRATIVRPAEVRDASLIYLCSEQGVCFNPVFFRNTFALMQQKVGPKDGPVLDIANISCSKQ